MRRTARHKALKHLHLDGESHLMLRTARHKALKHLHLDGESHLMRRTARHKSRSKLVFPVRSPNSGPDLNHGKAAIPRSSPAQPPPLSLPREKRVSRGQQALGIPLGKGDLGGSSYILEIISSAKAEHLTSVAPSMRRAKS